jgi:hypothetical protein
MKGRASNENYAVASLVDVAQVASRLCSISAAHERIWAATSCGAAVMVRPFRRWRARPAYALWLGAVVPSLSR